MSRHTCVPETGRDALLLLARWGLGDQIVLDGTDSVLRASTNAVN
ncbi:hypothetical protein [Mesorhizobium caraganae]|nr:hypothetical protein [Mesorhizobium caraganae]